MLYKLGRTHGIFDSLTPVGFQAISQEKDLENLLAKNLLEVLFEGNQLMPIFQERAFQAEADIYALNREGDLVIFELKRNDAGGGAVNQALRYCETAAHWSYEKLEHMFVRYASDKKVRDLREEHRLNFDLGRVDKMILNPFHYCCETYESEKGFGKFIVSCGDSAVSLESAEAVFDLVPEFADLFRIFDEGFSVGSRRYDGKCAGVVGRPPGRCARFAGRFRRKRRHWPPCRAE